MSEIGNRGRLGWRSGMLTVAAAAILAVAGCAPIDDTETGSAVTPSAPAAGSPAASSPAAGADANDSATWRPSGSPAVAATGLDAPWSVVPLADGTQLVSERDSGDVLEVGDGGESRVVGNVAQSSAGGEGGLHGLAVVGAPTGGTWLYAYVGTADDNRVLRMTLDGDAGARALGAPEVVLDGIPRDRVHNGGRIAVGPDGYLYVATGDATERDTSQDPESLAGKILRVTLEGAPAPDNPFGDEVYSLGHRNVQGLAWTADGSLWASEFGQDTFDELNRIEPGGNYGWPVHEGAAGEAGYIDPVLTWTPAEASPSGIAAHGDTVFVAGLRGERVWAVDVADSSVVASAEALWEGEFGRMRDAVVVGDELWLLTNNTDGRGAAGADYDRLLRVSLTARTS